MMNNDFTPSLDSESANLLGKNFFKVCEDLNINLDDQVVILGQKDSKQIKEWARMQTIGQTWDLFRRVSIILGIVRNLNTIYSRNPEVIGNWLHVKRNIFKGNSALELTRENPLHSQFALATIRRVLDMYISGDILELN
jgi:hypothetical protein